MNVLITGNDSRYVRYDKLHALDLCESYGLLKFEFFAHDTILQIQSVPPAFPFTFEHHLSDVTQSGLVSNRRHSLATMFFNSPPGVSNVSSTNEPRLRQPDIAGESSVDGRTE